MVDIYRLIWKLKKIVLSLYKECLTKTIIMYKNINIKSLARELAIFEVKAKYQRRGLMDKFYVNNYDEFMSLKISKDATVEVDESAEKYLEKIESVI